MKAEMEAQVVEVFHKRLVRLRMERGRSQLWMASKLGIARQTYLDLEYGKTTPKAAMLMAISVLLKIDMLWLVGWEDDNAPKTVCDQCEQIRVIVNRPARL